MGRYLLLWKINPARVPVDPKERGAGWSGLMGMIKNDMEKGITKDWGAFTGEGRGYTLVEGTETEISIMVQQYSPFVRFETHPVMSVNQVEEMLGALTK